MTSPCFLISMSAAKRCRLKHHARAELRCGAWSAAVLDWAWESFLRRWSFVVGRSLFRNAARRLAVGERRRANDERRSSVLQLLSDIFQCRPARIFRRLGTIALFLIQIAPAMWAQAFAILAADRLQRYRQQDLFP